MQQTTLKKALLLVCLLLPAVWCGANSTYSNDGFSHIVIKEKNVQGTPKGSSIQASIDGHYLTVIFTENLGQVGIEVTTSMGAPVETLSMTTPNGQVLYIALTGDYIVNFTLSNGDEYYGDFSVTD